MTLRLTPWFPFLLLVGLASAAHAQPLIFDAPQTNAPAANAQTPNVSPPPGPGDSTPADSGMAQSVPAAAATLLSQSFQALGQGDLNGALDRANAAILLVPGDANAYELRGGIYAEMKLWRKSEGDYETVLQIDPKNSSAKFNLVEIKLRQKLYDQAKLGFVALEKEESLSDLVTYKAFLCDLFGGHEDLAAKELDAFNQVGSNPSYYYANAAWLLVHHKTEEARSWIESASHIYTPLKNQIYASSLIDQGLMAEPPKPATLPR